MEAVDGFFTQAHADMKGLIRLFIKLSVFLHLSSDRVLTDMPHIRVHTGIKHKREWCSVHRAGRRTPNGTLREWGEHHPRREHERKHHEQGISFISPRPVHLSPATETIRASSQLRCIAGRNVTVNDGWDPTAPPPHQQTRCWHPASNVRSIPG